MTIEQSTPAEGRQNGFPRSAWEHVTIEAQDALTVSGKPGWGQLELTVTNRSGETLAPDSGQGVAFSFHLLNPDGQDLPFECVRTPLQASIPAGASHSQVIKVVIPEDYLEQTAAIRVSMLQLREYWVDQINPAHPGIVKIGRGPDLSPAEKIIAEASQLWPKGRNNSLKWPYSTMMVSERHRLLYIPIAKCACTSLKSMMVELAAIDHYERARNLGVHLVTDRFNTGVQLKDKPMDLAREILASDQYLKFSVVREPFERLVSGYLEKFVYNRNNARNLLHTRAIISEIQGRNEVDLNRGISFDEFASYILQQDSWDLDPHWRPQYLYMRGVRHMGRIFRLEQLDTLETWLQDQRTIQVTLAHKNVTGKSARILSDAATYTADRLDTAGDISFDSFLSSRYIQDLRDYFREDFELYRAAGET